MAYTAGDIIAADDLNGFMNVIDTVWGVGFSTRGYGQGDLFTQVTTGTIINGTSWQTILPRITILGMHQQNTPHPGIPLTSSFNSGNIIEALNVGGTNKDLPAAVTSIDTNRLTAHASSVTTFSGTSSSRSTSWGDSGQVLTHEITVTFNNVNDARYFFNSGGLISFTASRSGGSTSAANTNWTTLLSDLGIIRFGYANTTLTGSAGVGEAIGYYNLTTSYQRIVHASGAAYGVYDYALYAKTSSIGDVNGSNGKMITFKVEFTNGDDVVNGTLLSTCSFTKATTYLTINSPVVATITELTA